MKLIYVILAELLIVGCFFSGCKQILGDSEPPESIVQPPIEAMKIIVTEPAFGTIKNPGETLSIEWSAPTIRKIDIQLFRKNELKLTLIENLENEGKFDWRIPIDIPRSNHYLIKIMSHINNDIYELSGQFGIQ
ncbi:MAG TPA: GPI anchored serine-threonine rich family protein [Ignavibacteriaceae bacterium]